MSGPGDGVAGVVRFALDALRYAGDQRLGLRRRLPRRIAAAGHVSDQAGARGVPLLAIFGVADRVQVLDVLRGGRWRIVDAGHAYLRLFCRAGRGCGRVPAAVVAEELLRLLLGEIGAVAAAVAGQLLGPLVELAFGGGAVAGAVVGFVMELAHRFGAGAAAGAALRPGFVGFVGAASVLLRRFVGAASVLLRRFVGAASVLLRRFVGRARFVRRAQVVIEFRRRLRRAFGEVGRRLRRGRSVGPRRVRAAVEVFDQPLHLLVGHVSGFEEAVARHVPRPSPQFAVGKADVAVVGLGQLVHLADRGVLWGCALVAPGAGLLAVGRALGAYLVVAFAIYFVQVVVQLLGLRLRQIGVALFTRVKCLDDGAPRLRPRFAETCVADFVDGPHLERLRGADLDRCRAAVPV